MLPRFKFVGVLKSRRTGRRHPAAHSRTPGQRGGGGSSDCCEQQHRPGWAGEAQDYRDSVAFDGWAELCQQ
eukprot:1534928-Rhodomonas_salina.2